MGVGVGVGVAMGVGVRVGVGVGLGAEWSYCGSGSGCQSIERYTTRESIGHVCFKNMAHTVTEPFTHGLLIPKALRNGSGSGSGTGSGVKFSELRIADDSRNDGIVKTTTKASGDAETFPNTGCSSKCSSC
jgi:hypothetical protein